MRRQLFIWLSGISILLIAFFINSALRPDDPSAVDDDGEEITRRVHVVHVVNKDQKFAISLNGRVLPREKVEIIPEVSGLLLKTQKRFKIGTFFKAGDTIISIDSREEYLNLLSQRSEFLNSVSELLPDFNNEFPESSSEWSSYLLNFEIEEPMPLLPKSKTERERYYVSSRNIYSSYYSIMAKEKRISKYVVIAPFDGYLVEADAKEGSLAQINKRIGTFITDKYFEVESATSLKDLIYLSIGSIVEFYSPELDEVFTGRISRINKIVDVNTQGVNIYCELTSRRLFEGMYLTGKIPAAIIRDSYKIQKQLLTRNNQVYTVNDNVAVRRKVTPIRYEADSIIISGLKDGDLLITDNVGSAFEGTKISIDK